MSKTSSYSGFYKLPVEERLNKIAEFADLTQEEKQILSDPNSLSEEIADNMIENVIGRFSLPLSVAVNFIVNGKDVIVPMVTEEPSVVAAASNAAKMARSTGGFKTSYTGSIMIAQVQIIDVKDPNGAKHNLYQHVDRIKEICNEKDPYLVNHGGGFQDIEVRLVETDKGTMVVVHLKVDTLDAMGANAVNTMAEAVAPYLEELTGGTVYLRILSNLAVHRLARASVEIEKETLGGEDVVDRVVTAYEFAKNDPYRATTHNKGIMNGIIPVVLATGNDTRAIESGAHSYAAHGHQYTSLTTWEKNAKGNLVGTIELPMAVGLVGGATKIHPSAQVAIKILGVTKASELAEIIAAVGLAQNLAAVKTLATEGIQRGHMSLHARNVATVAGASKEQVDEVVKMMIEAKRINVEYAREILDTLNRKES